jgi:predicted small secreted protein
LRVKRFALTAAAVALAFGAAACNSTTTGQGEPTFGAPSSPVTSGAGDSGGSSPTSSSGGSKSLPVDKPCSLFSSSDLTTLGVSSPPSADQVGSAPTCDLSLNPDGAVEVGIRTNEGLSALAGTGPSTSLTVGSHPAGQQLDAASGGCLIVLGVSANSRVDVVVNMDDASQVCPTALKVAKLVEPHLPPSS